MSADPRTQPGTAPVAEHTPEATYPVGTRYSNSLTYDEATNEFVHGWQVFVQKREDGTPTGRKSFVNKSGILCGISIAAAERYRAIADAAPDLLTALRALVSRNMNFYGGFVVDCNISEEEVTAAHAAIAKATGSAS